MCVRYINRRIEASMFLDALADPEDVSVWMTHVHFTDIPLFQHLHFAFWCDLDIAGFQISVNHAPFVGGFESLV